MVSTVEDAVSVEVATVSDHRYFVGTVALLNSLRLTANEARVTVLDFGLTDQQRERLQPHASLIEPDQFDGGESLSRSAKPRLAAASRADVFIFIDSDIILTSSLDSVVEHVTQGKIVVPPDGPNDPKRWFAEWEVTFGLRAPPRRGQVFVNSGFVALSPRLWDEFLLRWVAACDMTPALTAEERLRHIDDYKQSPVAGQDQDSLNALLMSEVPRSSVHVLPYWAAPFPHHMSQVSVVDEAVLLCTAHGERVMMLHYVMNPKPWQPWGWTRAGKQAFLRLFPRVVLSNDVPVQLEADEIPRWLSNPVLRRLAEIVAPPARATVRVGIRVLPTLRWPLRRFTGRA